MNRAIPSDLTFSQTAEEAGWGYLKTASWKPKTIDFILSDKHAKPNSGATRALTVEIFAISKTENFSVLLSKNQVDSSIFTVGRSGFAGEIDVNLTPSSLPDGGSSKRFFSQIRVSAHMSVFRNKVIPYLGANKFDISKHLEWTGGYWIHFDDQKYSTALQAVSEAPGYSHSNTKKYQEENGRLSNTGDSRVDDTWNYFGVKCEIFGAGVVRGFFPFCSSRTTSATGQYSNFADLQALCELLGA